MRSSARLVAFSHANITYVSQRWVVISHCLLSSRTFAGNLVRLWDAAAEILISTGRKRCLEPTSSNVARSLTLSLSGVLQLAYGRS